MSVKGQLLFYFTVLLGYYYGGLWPCQLQEKLTNLYEHI